MATCDLNALNFFVASVGKNEEIPQIDTCQARKQKKTYCYLYNGIGQTTLFVMPYYLKIRFLSNGSLMGCHNVTNLNCILRNGYYEKFSQTILRQYFEIYES